MKRIITLACLCLGALNAAASHWIAIDPKDIDSDQKYLIGIIDVENYWGSTYEDQHYRFETLSLINPISEEPQIIQAQTLEDEFASDIILHRIPETEEVYALKEDAYLPMETEDTIQLTKIYQETTPSDEFGGFDQNVIVWISENGTYFIKIFSDYAYTLEPTTEEEMEDMAIIKPIEEEDTIIFGTIYTSYYPGVKFFTRDTFEINMPDQDLVQFAFDADELLNVQYAVPDIGPDDSDFRVIMLLQNVDEYNGVSDNARTEDPLVIPFHNLNKRVPLSEIKEGEFYIQNRQTHLKISK